MMTTNGAELIAEERQRQIHVEGWTMLHDVLDHAKDELVTAARCYRTAEGPDAPMPPEWPWEPRWWKPKDRERNLVRSGALLQAEIDVLHTVYEQSRMKIAELTAERDAIAAEIDALRAARSRREATK